jgi:hypothetical protein
MINEIICAQSLNMMKFPLLVLTVIEYWQIPGREMKIDAYRKEPFPGRSSGFNLKVR